LHNTGEDIQKSIYTGSSHNAGVVQSLCTSKGFHYNHSALQFAQGHNQKIYIFSNTTTRDFYALGLYLKTYAQGQLQKTSLFLRATA